MATEVTCTHESLPTPTAENSRPHCPQCGMRWIDIVRRELRAESMAFVNCIEFDVMPNSPLGRAIAREKAEDRKWIRLQRKAQRMGLGMVQP